MNSTYKAGESAKIRSAVADLSHDVRIHFVMAGDGPDTPIPGTRTWNDVIPTQRLGDAKLWHFYFHDAWNDVADLLTL